MSVAKISHTILDWRETLELFMKEKIKLWSMWQNFYKRMKFESLYTNSSWERLWIQLWSLWQKFHQSLQIGNVYTNSSWITQNTGLKLKIKDKEIINVTTVENSILKWQIWRYIWFLCPWWIILIWIIRLADLVIYFLHETHL